LAKTRGRDPSLRTGAAASPISATEQPAHPHSALALLALAVLSGVWLALAMTAFFVGPAEWDDNQYCNLAAIPSPNASVPNRYVHVWTLRIFYLLMDSRRTAAGLYSALTVVGLMWVAYFVGRRMSGSGGGLLAALLMPLYPMLLKYLTVPYCDEPMTLWSGVALACALLASEMSVNRPRGLAVAAAGLGCFLSVKCKETGLAVLPAVWLLLWGCDRRAKVLTQWVAGVLLGWVGLVVLDGVFMHDPWFSCRYSTYFPPEWPPDATPTIRIGMEYVELLLSRPLLAFSLLGAAGALGSFRENRVVRAVTVWAFGVLVFQSLISCHYVGIQALDRYAVGVGAPWVILAAHGIVRLWRRPSSADGRRPVALAVVLVLLVGLTAAGLYRHVSGEPDPQNSTWRCYFFLFPLTTVTLFAVPWLTGGQWLPRLSLVTLVTLTGGLSVSDALRYVKQSEAKLKPWITLVGELDRTGARLVTWNLPGKPFNLERIGWRCRALSARPPERITVRQVSSLEDVREDEWVVTDAQWWRSPTAEQRELLSRGWRPFVSGAEGQSGFVVCRRPAEKVGG
jgi:hypothetical protein